MRHRLPLIALLLCGTATAQVYRSVDDQGRVTFSDTPGPNSEQIQVQPLQTYTPRPLAPGAAPSGAAQGAPGAPAGATGQPKGPPQYTVRIAAPADGETLRSSPGSVEVSVAVEPELREQERVRLLLDGKAAAGPGATTSFTLQFVDRGAHVLRAEVLGGEDQVLARSPPVTFYLHRFSKNF